jgi:YHS domain-containing protein
MKSILFALVDVSTRTKNLAALVGGIALLSFAFAGPAAAGVQNQIGVFDVNVSHGLTFTGKKTDAPAPLALRGYDTVSYFTDGKPALGSVQHAAMHKGAIYWFASDEHKKMFEADPGRYAPQYGGFCAFGTTQQTKFDGDPLLWNIHKGKLYLNVTPDLQQKWLGKGLRGNSLEQNIAEADRIWPGIENGKPQQLFEAWLARQ